VTASESASVEARIRVETGFYEGLEWPLASPRVVLGRGHQADLVVSEPTISRSHVALICVEGQWFAEDLESTNGTLVNGAATDRSLLRDGDELQVGRLILRILLEGN
jgi:pSer/pThr/pTyr-binding forkhead associated (FHA) protein